MDGAYGSPAAAESFACMRCGRLQGSAARCEVCGDAPLLDVRQPNVRTLLLDEDDRHRSKHSRRIHLASVAIGIVLVTAGTLFVPPFASVILGAVPMFLGFPLAGALLALLAMLVLGSFFPYRFRYPYLRG